MNGSAQSLVFAVGAAATAFAAQSGLETRRSLPFPHRSPTQKSAGHTHEEMPCHRATQVAGWSLPALTLWYMKQGSEAEYDAGSEVLVIRNERLGAEAIVSTPNSGVFYGMA